MKQAIHLTEGSIKRQLAALAAPLLLGNILQQLYNTVDAIVIGRYTGQTAFAAVGVAGTIMNLFTFMLGGCCAGVSVIFAQLYGGGDYEKFRREGFLAVAFGGAFTILVSAAAILLVKPLLDILQTPANVAAYAQEYLVIVICGFIATFLYSLCAAALRAMGSTRTALLILAFAMFLNLILDLVFVAVFRLGVAGAAWATVISQFLSAAVCCLYLKRAFPQVVFRKSDMRFDGVLLKKTLHFGAVSALHQSSLYIGKMLVQGAVNTMGTEMIAAFTAATRIEGFANSIGDSGGEAISIFVAQNTGYGSKRRANRGFLTGLVMMALLGIMLSLVMHVTANAGIALMLGRTSGAASDNGIAYMRAISFFYTLCFTGNSFVGMYRGIGKVNIPVLGTVLHISLRVILSYLLIGGMGLKAVALATGTGWVTVVLFQTLVYLGMLKKQKETQDGHKGKALSFRKQRSQ